MNNTLTLTDHELAVIQTSLQMSLKSFEMYIKQYGEDSLGIMDKQAFEDMRKLWERFNKEFF